MVVSPAPFGPRRPYVSPLPIRNEMPSTALTGPKDRCRSVHRSTSCVDGAAGLAEDLGPLSMVGTGLIAVWPKVSPTGDLALMTDPTGRTRLTL